MDFGNLAIFQRYFMSDPDGTYALLDYLVQGTMAPTPDTLSHGGPISLAGPGPPRTLRRLWASAKLCGVEQRAPPILDRAAITMGIGPHF